MRNDIFIEEKNKLTGCIKVSKSINKQLGLLMSLFVAFYSHGGDIEMSIPEDIKSQFLLNEFSLINTANGQMDGDTVTTYRYQRSSPITYFGEHISFVFSPSKKIKGMTRMTKEFVLTNEVLPTEKQAREVARNFIASYAKDLLNNMEVQWIKQHDETINIGSKSHIISGMKVKCRNLVDGKYFWVIVGKDDEVIVFERDIVWNFIRGGRQTEKWLHDDWLNKF